MKKASIIFTALIAVSLLFISWKKATKVESAIHIGPFSCGVLDGYGNGYLATGAAVTTSSNNTNMKCAATGVPAPAGKSTRYNFANTGFLCGTPGGVTPKWNETVTGEGDVSLTCQLH